MILYLFSSAFGNGEAIPADYTADGRDISPPLQWDSLPPETESLALVCEDPDAPVGNWVHWVVYNIPPERKVLPEGISADEEVLEDGTTQGENSWGRIGYGGPSPPSGTHRYFFRLYALDTSLDLEHGLTSDELRAAFEGHVVEQAELMGRYGR
ncbi:YbhB/YbcL family Raf kinase inhibitor-like protein [Candidatus Fermentibacteria bacterium]|nr:YbhB/YbcL family Raf kinase inhibitor-like protein [Candidatus Fermentibacteria bacterium]